MTAVEWARTNGVRFTWRCALDNYEPARSTAQGEGWFSDNPGGIVLGVGGFVLRQTELRDAHRAVYLIDDGTVCPYYVGGWHEESEYILLRSFPTSTNPPANYATWQLGPRRAYHLKIVRA